MRKSFFVVLAALVTCGVFVAFGLRWEGATYAGDVEAGAPRVLLTIHGPNDGEPLNNRVEFSVQVSAQTSAYLVIYEGNRLLGLHLLRPEGNDDFEVFNFSLDTTFFPNGPFDLHVYLFDEELCEVLAGTDWVGTVDNPDLEIPPQDSPLALIGKLEGVKVKGRFGDRSFRIVAGTNLVELLQSPAQDHLPAANLQVLAEGYFSGLAPPGGSEGRNPVEEIALKVDILIRQQTRDSTFIVLWCKDAGSKWAHSKPIALRSLLSAQSGIIPVRPPKKTTGPLLYRR